MQAVIRSRAIVFLLTACAMLSSLTLVPAYATDADAARLCRSDAIRLCLSEIPDRDRITACMKQNRAQLSAGCQSVFNGPSKPATIETASRLQ